MSDHETDPPKVAEKKKKHPFEDGAPEATGGAIIPDGNDDDDRTVLFTPEDLAKAQEAAGAAPALAVEETPPSPVDDDGFGIADDSDRTVLAPAIGSAALDAGKAAAAAAKAAPQTPALEDDDGDRTIVTTSAPNVDEATVVATNVPTFTETPDMSAAAQAGRPMPLSTLEPGSIINNMYRVEERLDQGGMGRVFRGAEIGTGEAVAIKVILPEMAEDDKITQMFRREARTLRQLHHDAIVRYFAYVPPDENLNMHALVMGFIQGTKLSDKLEEDGRLTSRQAVKLTMRLADGLERAHQIGVVHRDLSPDNVMLPDGDIEQAVLIDFGISRSSKVKDVTIGNEFAGKLKYVSPEQLGAYGGEAEGPSDVYSLGLLVIAMLTGKPVPMGSSIVEAVQKRQDVPDLTGLPFEFHDILTQMLQPDPKQRLPSMQAVIDILSDFDGATTGMSRRGTRAPVEDRAVPGLQAVPMAARNTGTTALGSNAAQEELAKAGKRSGGFGMLVSLGLVSVTALAGYVLFGDEIQKLISASAPEAAVEATDAVEQGLERQNNSRATFLANAVPGECNFAVRRAQGPSTGVIEGFGQQAAALRSLGADFGTEYGILPDVLTRTVQEVHCPVLDFARTFQGTRGTAIELSLAANVTPRSEGVVGTLHGSAGRENFLALVDRSGRIFSLMRQLDDPIGEERRFAFRLPTATPGIYMLIATASESTLVRAGALQDGTLAADFLPLLQRELAVDGQGTVDIGYLELTK